MCDICNTIEKSLQGENPFFVKELETGIVVLGWNQHFYGYTIFMCKKHATELYQLEDEFLAKFMEEMVIPYEGKNFAVLVSIDDCCEDEDCDCHNHEEDDEDYCIIARIDFDENGEAVYTAPTDEEYEAVAAKYDEMFEDEE